MIGALVVAFFAFAGFYADWLWFQQLGFLNVLTTQWFAMGVMFLIGFFAMAIPVWLSIELAYRFRPVYAKLNSQLDRYQQVVEPLRRIATYGIPILLGTFAGVAASSRWELAAVWLNRTPAGVSDPQFGLDISFYLFELPFYHAVLGFASAVVLLSAVAALATSYLYGAIAFNGREVRISKTARIQLAITGAVYVLLQAVSLWLDQYLTLVSSTSTTLMTGAAYTDVNAVIPGKMILALSAAAVAVLFIVTAIIGRWRLPIIGTAVLLVLGLIVGTVYPLIIQRFQVDPSARSLEAPYLQRNIEATRAAFGVDGVVERHYPAVTDAELGALRDDAATTANIRIIDPALITDTFRQFEQVRQFYQFSPYLDVDRYEINGEVQDTVIALRELDQRGQSSGGWYNDTIVYTHGFGVVAAYGNQRESDGLPVFIESGIPSSGDLGTFEPRIYFGEFSPEYSIVGAPEGATPLELDYPAGGESGTSNATYTFDGDGGPKLDNFLNQLVYALKFQSTEIVLSDAVNSASQVLYERNPRDRVQLVAPYLRLDNDAYPAIVDERIVWIVDGYTTSDHYPYSAVRSLSGSIADSYTPRPIFAVDNVNYIRNSVKATVDAFDGTVTLYTWDEEDPVLQTWQKIFPSTLKPMSEMSDELLKHIRYPADLFKVQRAILGTYHVTSSDTFYSGDDAWVTPNDPISNPNNPTLQPAYYLTMQTPGSDAPAFTIYSTYIPDAQGPIARNVLTGYLTANSDWGPDYGKLTLLTLPSQTTVPGPGQVQAQFDSDDVVGQQLNLLRQGQTTVIPGNLLTLPVGGGLLYVQPVYVKSTGETSYPLLRKILVAFGQDIAFEDTLDEALDALFGGDSGASAGDGDVEPSDPEEPADPGEQPADPGDETGAMSPELRQALNEAAQALRDREAAYARNDLVAAAQADQRLQNALARAIELSR
ncbi:MAG: UPF0182 family protein [Cryobacterium sp.]|nr:UPF0182 family protein [Cryobacterium sp.]